jgi:hypothetical protein
MANTFGNPIMIDTAGATSEKRMRFRIIEIRWVGAATPGDQAVIQDPITNQVLWEDICPGGNYVTTYPRDMVWENGFRVATLGSGRLSIRVG